MRKLSLGLFTLFFTFYAQAVCMTPANGTQYKCERFYDGDAFCLGKYGRQFKAYTTSSKCSKVLAKKLRDDSPEHRLVDQAKSLLDEIETQLTQIDRHGLNDEDILFGSIKTVDVSSFNDKAIKNVIKKLKNAAHKVHAASMIDFKVDSASGHTLIQMATKYIQLSARIHQLYANMAHKYLKNYGSFDYKNIGLPGLKIHKKFGLEILAKVNLKARHLNKEELEIVVSEDEKQNFEYMAIHQPESKDKYAKLVQFLAIREAVTNKWAIQRLSTTTLNDPAVRECGGNFLSYRPKEDGSTAHNGYSSYKAKRMSRSDAYQELLAYDKFWNDYVPKIEDLEKVTKKHSIITEDLASDLVQKLIEGVPTIEYTLIEDFGWEEYEIEDWKWEVAVTIADNEKNEWENYARTILSVSVFPGDDLATEKVVSRIVNDSFMIRYESIMAQLYAVLEVLPQEDLNTMAKITKQFLDNLKGQWEGSMKEDLKKVISEIHKSQTVANKNYKEKIEEGVLAAKSALPAAHIINEINKGVKSKKYNASQLYKYSKFDSNILDPATPQELIVYLTMKLGTHYDGKRISYSMDNDSQYSEAAQEFFQKVSAKYSEKVKADDSRVKKAKVLFQVASEVSKELALANPYNYRNHNHRPDNQQYRASKSSSNNGSTFSFDDFYKYTSFNTFAAESTSEYKPVIYPMVTDNAGVSFTNTDGVTYNTNSLTDMDVYNYNNPNYKTASTDESAASSSSYEVMNMVRLSPVVADNTRVAIDHRIMQYNELMEQVEDYNPFKPELMVNDKGEFYFYLFQILLAGQKKEAGKLANASFLRNLNDQRIMAEHFLGEAYNGVPLLKIEVPRDDKYKSQTTCGTYGNCVTTNWWAETKAPALMRLVQTKRFEKEYDCKRGEFKKRSKKLVTNMKAAVTFPSHNSIRYDEGHIKCVIDEVIKIAREAVGQVHQKFDKTQMQMFCDADFTDYKNDDDYKTLFKSVTAIRDSITNDQSLHPQKAEELKQWDEQLQKDTRYWHEAVNEDIIEPMLWVAAGIFILGTIILSWLGSAGTLAPATVALLIMIIDVADIAITGASLYFKGMTNFYELPAQAKFQESLAVSQIDSQTFTTFEDVAMTNAKISQGRMMMGFEALFAPIVGAQFSQSAKRFAGITGKRALSRFGMPVRHFGQPPKSVLIKRSFKELRKEFGFVGALSRKTADMVHNAKRWMPRYQTYTMDELQDTVRVGLTRKAVQEGIADKPWVLIDEVDRMIKRVDDRIVKAGEFADDFGSSMNIFRMQNRLTFKEALKKPFYMKELFIPKSLIRALRKETFKEFIANFGTTMEKLNKLRNRFLIGKADKLKAIRSKLEDAKTLAAKNPEYLKEKDFSNYFDYFQSTLTKEEIRVFRDIAKHERNVVKMVTGNYQGKSHVFVKVFKDHDKIMETVEPLVSRISGQALRSTRYYKNPVTQIVKETIDDIDVDNVAVKVEDDLVEFYESMLRHDAVENVKESTTILLRQDIEDTIY